MYPMRPKILLVSFFERVFIKLRPAGGSLPSAIGRGEVAISHGYGRGNSGLVLSTKDKEVRFEDVAENHESGLAVSMDVSSHVTKEIADALACLISRIVSDTLKDSGYDLVLAHREPRLSDDDQEPRVYSRVSARVSDQHGDQHGDVFNDFTRAVHHGAILGADSRGDVDLQPRFSAVVAAAEKALSGVVSDAVISRENSSAAISSAEVSDVQVSGDRASGARVSDARVSKGSSPARVSAGILEPFVGNQGLPRYRWLVWRPVQRQRRASRHEKGKGIMGGSSSSAV
ncbi:hypothetical protein NE237_013105 [Protea cynaroides]|uniref:Uncharacterized protein n=1 Tax=Protea cynaroides TaxID=273540 RepID=A0A9Q0H2B7_9MAGN|nr:hypothetical protein NE237_013105 [Protea cynaroides]